MREVEGGICKSVIKRAVKCKITQSIRVPLINILWSRLEFAQFIYNVTYALHVSSISNSIRRATAGQKEKGEWI